MRSKGLFFILISFLFVSTTYSQSNELIIKGQTGKLYLEHIVVAKENWYSIGRLYNISPKEIAPFNNLTLDKSLGIGQTLQIPLTAANFSQNGQKTAAETLVPVYHVVQEKEWLYRVSVNHNKVPIGVLEKWNNVTGDQVKTGMHLIVGYLKVKTALSAFAGVTRKSADYTVGIDSARVYSTTAPVRGTLVPDGSVPVNTAPGSGANGNARAMVVGTEETRVTSGVPAAGSTATVPAASVPAAPVPAAPVPAAQGSVAPGTGASAPAVVPPASSESVTAAVVTKPAASHPVINFNGGYFKSDFNGGSNTASGLAGIFKSTSGWQDGKYYALMNNVPVGTIVKISIPAAGKSVYAKVLGALPDMKESAGLTIRVSNAAASELGGDGRFGVEVRY